MSDSPGQAGSLKREYFMQRFGKRAQKTIASALMLLLMSLPAMAGLIVTGSNGIATTGVDGVSFINTSGIATTGVDGLLAFNPNGIATTGVDGIATTGVDGLTFLGSNGIATTGVDGLTVTGADGIAVTGVDGIAVTGVDGQTFQADSLIIQRPQGIATTGVDGLDMIGVSGIATTGVDSFDAAFADGMTATGADGITVAGAEGIAVTGVDGQVFSISPNGIAVTGVDNIIFTCANGIAVTGADGIATTGVDDIYPGAGLTGLQSLDPELALLLDRLTDDSNVNAIVVYHHLPAEADIADLQQLGITGGVRYRALPMIAMTTTKRKLIDVSRLPAVRSIYGARTLQLNSDPYISLNCAERIPTDSDLTADNQGLPVSGNNVAVAVLDTGVDGTHSDLAGRVTKNVKVLDTLGLGVGFINPINIEGLSNTDLLSGHGTFVAGVIAGNGARSSGRYAGVAPGANIVGVSAGDLSLLFVLAGFDYILDRASSLNIRVVNCSFSANTVFDFNDPVNIATRLLTDAGINVVFSAGNSGPGMSTLNPYAVAPWVVGVGATDERGRLAAFSSRGAFANLLFHPTLVAPGTSVVGPRALGVTGVLGLPSDIGRLSLSDLSWYTTASGTSFSAPQVAATIAMMLEANPDLTPAQIKDILQRTATPMAEYHYHEAGAGMLNAHAAVLEAAFPDRRMGAWRATLDKKTARFVNDPPQQVSGIVPQLGGVFEKTVSIPQNTVLASVQIAWGPVLSTADLGLKLIDPAGQVYSVNTLNLPGLTGKRERLIIKMPTAGVWRVRVNNSALVSLTTQPFTGAVEVTRAEMTSIQDIGTLSAAEQAEIYQTLRTRVMTASSNRFRPQFGVTRAALAEAMVLGARVPQYLAAGPSYTDVSDLRTRNFVESAQLPANGALFPEDGSGLFRPRDMVDRTTAAVVLVRAAGLAAQAEAQSGASLPISDGASIPAELRGYVAVALAQGLMTAAASSFRPQAALTRVELAHAMVALQRLATQ